MMRLAVLAILGLLVTASPALALTVTYVSTRGNDANTCTTPADPCRTVGAALAKADALGQPVEVRIASGTYKTFIALGVSTPYEVTVSGGWNAGFTTQSASTPTILKPDKSQSGRVVVLTSGGATSQLTAALRHLTISGGALKVFDGTAPGAGLLLLASGPATLILDHVTVTGNKANEFGGGGLGVLVHGTVAQVTVGDSAFTKNSAKGAGGAIRLEATGGGQLAFTADKVTIDKNKAAGQGGGVSVSAETGGTVTALLSNCFVSRNTVSDGEGGGITVDVEGASSSSFTLLGCAIAGNAAKTEGGGMRVEGGDGSLVTAIRNTIVWGNTADVGDDLSLGPDVTATSCSLVSSNVGETDGACADAGGNVSPAVDPLFVKASAGNLHLQPASPLRDLGNCALGPSDDIDGESRPAGAGCDIGADEIP